MRFFGVCLVFFLMSLPGYGTEAGQADRLYALFSEEWQERIDRNPFMAVSAGVEGYGDRLPDVSQEAQDRFLQTDRGFLTRLQAIDRASLTQEDQVNYDIFHFVLKSRIDHAAFKPWRIPFLADAGFHIQLASSVEASPVSSVQDYEDYIGRLAGVGNYFDQQIANMRIGLADGFSQPQAILAKIAPSFKAHAGVASPEDSVFYAPFKDMPATIQESDKKRLRAEGLKVVGETVVPAYQRLNSFFVEEYMARARTTLGAVEMPDGASYYDQRVKYYTTTDLSAAEVHALGRSEVARIRGEMDEIIESVGFTDGFAAFLEFLRTDPQFYAETPKELLQEAAWISKRIDEKLPGFFGRLPRMPYGVRAVPEEIAANYTTGRYWGAIPGKRGGLFMVNTYALDKRPLYSLAALALHEGVPGHHLQNALSKEVQNVPEFRKNLYVNAFGEGWGLYAEKLGIDMGIYETPYEHFGRLSYEMWRAGRLVVDTGLHAMGWSRDEAVAFFAENSALSLHNINTEVDRYIAWPGQALAYKMGELKILELRGRAKRALGDRFDIRAFHDAVLENGTLPLSLLEVKIDAYIESAVAEAG